MAKKNIDWKTIAIIILVIAVVVLFVLQFSGNSAVGLSPGQYEQFKAVDVKTSGDHARLGVITDVGKASILKLLTNQAGNNGWLISREPTNNDLRFYSYGKAAATGDGEALRVDYKTGDLKINGSIIQNGIRKESYLLRAKIYFDSSANRNEVDIERYTGSNWETICKDKI